MYRIPFAFLLAAFCCVFCAAADSPLLPDQFGPWQADGPSKMLPSREAFQGWGDVNLEALKEDGLVALEQRSYTNESARLRLNLFQFKDPSDAYEFYTQVLRPEMQSGGIGDESAFDSGHGAVLIGNFVLIPGPSAPETKPGGLGGLGPLIPLLKAKADPTPYPPLKNYLPKTWRVFGTERYVQGPVGFENAMDVLGQGAYRRLSKEVGFQDGAEAIFAKYQGKYGSGTLLLLEYPTPQLAEQHLHHLRQALPDSLRRSGVTVERKASLLSLVFAATAPEHAQAIRDEVNYETEVTWNESSHKATDPPIFLIMFKIFLFTGLFLGVATGVGIAFGGLRVIIKRLFPGKVFDRPEDIEVLQLGLSGKKIDPTDMY
jgi:hypothetical protein